MRALAAALAFLTRLPVPRGIVRAEDFGPAVRLHPLAGLAVGAVAAGAGWAAARHDPWLGAVAALLAWTAVTGALHLDGLADLADGLGAAHGDRARLLAVMADPHVGSFGTVAIMLQLLVKLVTLHLLVASHAALLVAIPAAARIGPLVWARLLRPLRQAGLGAAIAGAVRWRDVGGWLAILLGAAVAMPPLIAAPGLIAILAGWFAMRLGGVSGDVHGAGIELVESGLLLAGAIYVAG